MSRRAIAHRRADQGRVILASIRDRAPAVGLLGALLARAVPDKPTTTDAKPTTTEGGAQ